MKQAITVIKKPKNNASLTYALFIKYLKKDLDKYNPTLKNILKTEELLVKYKQFDSKNQLFEKLNRSMRPPVLTVILSYLEKSNKILKNSDGSLTWIYASPQAIEVWKNAKKL